MKPNQLRYAVLADIHGNLPALEAVLEHAADQGIDGVIVAGDLVGGPDTDAVIKRLQPHAQYTIAGNNEQYLVAFEQGHIPPDQRDSHQWTFSRTCFRRTTAATRARIAALPAQLLFQPANTAAVRVVHGSTASNSEPLYPNGKARRLLQVLDDMRESVLICGHTHRHWTFRDAGRLAFNPGSTGAPCNGDPRAQYGVMTWEDGDWQVDLHAVDYDLDLVRARFSDSGFLAEAGPMARAQLEGIVTAVPTIAHLVRHAFAMAREAGLSDVSFVPDDIWDQAIDCFDWQLPPP
jgi:putative phosphoesterase